MASPGGPIRESVTQSRPQMTVEDEPWSWLSKTRTDQSFTPGATPTTAEPLSLAPMIPATWLP